MKSIAAPILVTVLLLTIGCAPDLFQRDIKDLERMPQAPIAYLDTATSNQPLLSHLEQQKQADDFMERHFIPWHTEMPLESTNSPFWAIDWIEKNMVFGENLRPLGQSQRQTLIDQASAGAYPNLNRRAITVRRSDLRALPTSKPFSTTLPKPGKVFLSTTCSTPPFQQTLLCMFPTSRRTAPGCSPKQPGSTAGCR